MSFSQVAKHKCCLTSNTISLDYCKRIVYYGVFVASILFRLIGEPCKKTDHLQTISSDFCSGKSRQLDLPMGIRRRHELAAGTRADIVIGFAPPTDKEGRKKKKNRQTMEEVRST